ncbi:MAG: LbtU family siderophore porin [Pseudomonadota bacterium]|nr:LbtU family siderophore porin [Pseudomonadota bacterium]
MIAEEESVRYTTREERRDAGVKHEITDWLTASGLLEFEGIFQSFSLSHSSSHPQEDDFTKTLQLGLEISPLSWMRGELIYEYDHDDESNKQTTDEAILALEGGDFELELGKLFVPFGEYFSHFVSGPLLEFGETRTHDWGVTLSYGPHDRLDLAAFVYEGRARKAGSNAGYWDWGFAVEASPFESSAFGMSYLSDLADSQERLLTDSSDRYETRVDALSAYVVFGFDRCELTAEFVAALDSFKEFGPDKDQPSAWNVELASFPRADVQLALRLEGSSELEGAPRYQGGIALGWRFTNISSVTLESLLGAFKRGLAEDSRERDLDKVHQIGAQLSIEL